RPADLRAALQLRLRPEGGAVEDHPAQPPLERGLERQRPARRGRRLVPRLGERAGTARPAGGERRGDQRADRHGQSHRVLGQSRHADGEHPQAAALHRREPADDGPLIPGAREEDAMADQEAKDLREVLRDAPTNWGRWGPDDELGALNFLTREEVLRGVRSVRSGKVFTLGVPVGRPEGDPIYPGRGQPKKLMAVDKGFYLNGRMAPFPGGIEYADDVIFMYVQGTTQYDALGHTWYDDRIYNGYDARTTIGGLQKCSIEPMAEHGVVGRGLLLDVARFLGVDHLPAGHHITLDELRRCAAAQQSPGGSHHIPVVSTG